jgi:hypothetical protein
MTLPCVSVTRRGRKPECRFDRAAAAALQTLATSCPPVEQPSVSSCNVGQSVEADQDGRGLFGPWSLLAGVILGEQLLADVASRCNDQLDRGSSVALELFDYVIEGAQGSLVVVLHIDGYCSAHERRGDV